MEQAAKKGDLLQSESRVQALEVERVEVIECRFRSVACWLKFA